MSAITSPVSGSAGDAAMQQLLQLAALQRLQGPEQAERLSAAADNANASIAAAAENLDAESSIDILA